MNATVETAHEKPMIRKLLRERGKSMPSPAGIGTAQHIPPRRTSVRAWEPEVAWWSVAL